MGPRLVEGASEEAESGPRDPVLGGGKDTTLPSEPSSGRSRDGGCALRPCSGPLAQQGSPTTATPDWVGGSALRHSRPKRWGLCLG